MKLYTEEQVRKAINDGSLYSYINGDFEFKNSEDDIINALTPIELPSDEDIYSFLRGKKMYECDWEFIKGAKWMKEQILKNK
jgi:hypothetical protein